jgi:hypothetical protein
MEVVTEVQERDGEDKFIEVLLELAVRDKETGVVI